MKDDMPREIIATHYHLDGTESSGYWAGPDKTVSAHVAWTRYVRADADAEVRKALADRLEQAAVGKDPKEFKYAVRYVLAYLREDLP